MTKLADSSFMMKISRYMVTGRQKPTEKIPEPVIYRMTIFARDTVVAKSRFWYFLQRLHRIKKANGEILEVKKLEPTDTEKIKNYAIWFRYDSRTHALNMYKEFRDISMEGAVSQMYNEMAGRHRAAACSIQILKIKEIKDEELRRTRVMQFTDKDLKFPHIRRRPMCPKAKRPLFVAKPTLTFYH